MMSAVGYQLHQGDCLEVMRQMEGDSVDLTVTSPPYDNLRTYNGNNELWGEHVWKAVIAELFRVTKQGGVVLRPPYMSDPPLGGFTLGCK